MTCNLGQSNYILHLSDSNYKQKIIFSNFFLKKGSIFHSKANEMKIEKHQLKLSH